MFDFYNFICYNVHRIVAGYHLQLITEVYYETAYQESAEGF